MTNPILVFLRADDPHYEVYPLAEPIRELVRDYAAMREGMMQIANDPYTNVFARTIALSLISAKHLELLNAVKEGV